MSSTESSGRGLKYLRGQRGGIYQRGNPALAVPTQSSQVSSRPECNVSAMLVEPGVQAEAIERCRIFIPNNTNTAHIGRR